jgi:hypothetical protein
MEAVIFEAFAFPLTVKCHQWDRSCWLRTHLIHSTLLAHDFKVVRILSQVSNYTQGFGLIIGFIEY